MVLHGNKVLIRPITNLEVLGQERKPSSILLYDTLQAAVYNDWFDNGRYGEVLEVGSEVYYNIFKGENRGYLIEVGDVVRLTAPLASNKGVVGDDVINSTMDGYFYAKPIYAVDGTETGSEQYFFNADGGIVRDFVQVQAGYRKEEWLKNIPAMATFYWARQAMRITTDPEFKTGWDKNLVPMSFIKPATGNTIEG